MADSTIDKNRITLDDFPEDADGVFNRKKSSADQQIGNIDENDAIDRLLMGDNFPSEEADTLADIKEPALEAGHENKLEEFTNFAADNQWLDDSDELSTPELIALEQVENIEEIAFPDPHLAIETIDPLIQPEEIEKLALQLQTHNLEIAELTSLLETLRNQQQALKQLVTEKADLEELDFCNAEINKLKSLNNTFQPPAQPAAEKKPLLPYLTLATAATALLLAFGLASQGYNNKPDAELNQNISKLQEQLDVTANRHIADTENLQKQLDEIKASEILLNNQVLELNKVIIKSPQAMKPDKERDKKIAVLNAQKKQLDAKLDDLQNTVSELKKNTNKVIPSAPKPANISSVPTEQNWTVNLISVKQDWYAKRKAKEYAQKGIPAKVSKASAKGGNWYRLSVEGFKSQAEAATYAAKVKKDLNLDSTWVSYNKD